MKIKKLVIAGAIALLAVGASFSTSTDVQAKSKVVTVKKASQVKKAKKKALKCYNGGTAYVVKGKSKYVKKVKSAVISDIKKKNNLKWVNPLYDSTTSSKKKLKKYKSEVKYLSKIVEEVRQQTSEYKEKYSDFISAAKMTDSQVNSYVLTNYTTSHMHYKISPDCYFTGDYKRVYNGKYYGDCGGSSHVVINIAKALGFKTRYFSDSKERHAWMCVEAVDTDGTKYWRGVSGSASSSDCTYNSKAYTKGKSYVAKYSTDQEFFQTILNREDVGIENPEDRDITTATITLKVGESITIPATCGDAYLSIGKINNPPLSIKEVNGSTVITAIAKTDYSYRLPCLTPQAPYDPRDCLTLSGSLERVAFKYTLRISVE